MIKLGNKEILAAVKLVLNTETEYGLSVDNDAKGTPIIKVAPGVKATPNNAAEKMKVFLC